MTKKRLIRTINDIFENYNELDGNTPIIICHNGIKYDIAFHIDNPDEFIIVTGKTIDGDNND